jgi:hypothetical protein
MAEKVLSAEELALAEYKRQFRNATGRDMPETEEIDDYHRKLLLSWATSPKGRPAPSLFC